MPTKLLTLLAVMAFALLVTVGSLLLFQVYSVPEEGMGISLKDEKKAGPKQSSTTNQNQQKLKRKPPTQKRKPPSQKRKPTNNSNNSNQHEGNASGIVPAQAQDPDQIAGVDLDDLGDFTLSYQQQETTNTSPDQDAIDEVRNASFTTSDEVYSKLLTTLGQLSGNGSGVNNITKDEDFIHAVDDLIAKHLTDSPFLLTPGLTETTKETSPRVLPSAEGALLLALNSFNSMVYEESPSLSNEEQLLSAVDQLVAARVGNALNGQNAIEAAAVSADTASGLVDSTLLSAVEELFEVLETNPIQTLDQEAVLDEKLLAAVDGLVAARVGKALAQQEEKDAEVDAVSSGDAGSEDNVNIALNDAVNQLLKLRSEAAKRRKDTAVASAEQPVEKSRIDFNRVNKDALIKDLYDITIEYIEGPP